MNKLQNRLIISFTFIILVTLCGVSTIFSILIIRLPQQERITFLELNTQARSIIAVIQRFPNLLPARFPRFQLLDEISGRQDVRVALADADRTVLYDSGHVWDTSSDFDLFSRLSPTVGERWSGQIREEGRTWLVVAHPAPDASSVQQYLILAKPLNRPIRTILIQLRDTVAVPLLQAGAIVLTLGIILSISISRSIARPLRKVSQATDAVSRGRYDVSVEAKGPEEIIQLARSFNTMAEKIQASLQAQNDLVANVAHDLRTPLTSIQGYAQALIDGTANHPESRHQAALTIFEESCRMEKMTKTLLELAKFQAGEITLHLTDVDLIQLLRERAAFFQKQIEDAGLKLILDDLPAFMSVQVDRERLIQVLDNLLSNAITYTQPEGSITLSATIQETWATMSVIDTGCGIPKEEVPRIFERFYRGDRSRQGTGTGLGLSIAREIITAHHGTIDVESVVGVGSKFTIKLPRDTNPQ